MEMSSRCIRNKIMNEQEWDALGVCETHLKREEKLMSMFDYKTVSRQRQINAMKNCRGGVGFFLKNLEYEEIPAMETQLGTESEQLWIKVRAGQKVINLAIIYRTWDKT